MKAGDVRQVVELADLAIVAARERDAERVNRAAGVLLASAWILLLAFYALMGVRAWLRRAP